MSTIRSRPTGARTRPRPDRRRWTIAALCALSCFGGLSYYLRTARAQDAIAPAPSDPLEVHDPAAPLAIPAGPTNAFTPPAAEEPNATPQPMPPAETKKADGKVFKAQSLDALLERKGSIALREGTLAHWLSTIQETWHVDILYDSDELQRVTTTGQFTDTPLKTILDTLLASKGYGYRREENVLVIMKKEDLGETLQNQKRAMIRMEYVSPSEVMDSLNLLKSPNGKISSIPSAKALMVIDHPENIEKIREHIEELEDFARKSAEKTQQDEQHRQQLVLPPTGSAVGPSQSPNIAPDIQPAEQAVTTVLRPRFVSADSLVDAIATQIGDGTVTAIPETNDLVVTGSKAAILTATQIMQGVDVIKKQVRISVLMYDIRVDALEQLGVNWRNAAKGRINSSGIPQTLGGLQSSPMALGGSSSSTGGSTSGTATGTATGTTTGTATTGTASGTAAGVGSFVTSAAPNIVGSALTLTHLSRHFDLSAVFSALAQTDGARLLAKPSILCYDRKQSETKIISEIPVQQLTQTDRGGNIGTTTFREAGVTLNVTPWIGDNGVILLNLAPEFSVLTGFQAGQPIIDRRNLTQWVTVQSGETLVLGGLRRQNQLETVSGIPGLMNLKYVGGLFRSHQTSVEESELITFIHTEIVDVDYHGHLREQAAAQVVEETLDRIPIASHSPYVPPCNDPYCPIHNPQPKYWEGNMLEPQLPPPGYSASAPPYLQPRYPHREHEFLPPVEGQRIEDGPSEDVAPPRRLAPVAPPVPEDEIESSKPESDHADPPPVKVEENARRLKGSRMVLFRLPKVTPDPVGNPAGGSQPLVAGAPAAGFPARVATKPATHPGTPSTNPAPAPAMKTTAPAKGWQQLFR